MRYWGGIAVLAMGVAGCGVSIDSPGTSGSTQGSTQGQTQQPASPQPSDPASQGTQGPATGKAPGEGVFLHRVPAESGRGSGVRTSASLDGDPSKRVYAESAALWVGCDGAPDNVNFTLDGRYRTLRGVVGFRTGAAPGVKAKVVAYGDGQPITAFQVDHDGGYQLQLVVTDVKVLSFAVTREAGECQPSQDSYLVVADGVLQ